MNHNSDKRIILADYIFEDLGPEEMIQIEQEIKEDPEVSELYNLNVNVKDYLKAKIQLEEMKSDPCLAEAEELAEHAFEDQDTFTEDRASKPKVKPWVKGPRLFFTASIAATIAALVLISVFKPFTNTERLFQGYYAPLNASDYSQRGETSSLYKDLSEGINRYIQGDYEESTVFFNQMGSVYADQPEVQFFSGLAYLGLEQYEQAGVILADYVEHNTRFLPEALWYLSLTCLKTGDIAQARDLLIRLSAYEGMYKRSSQLLERKLRRIK